MFLTLSQKQKRRKELEREKEEKEVREHKEKFEVRHDLRLLRPNVVLTPSQKEKRQREFELEKEARERREKLEVRATLLLPTGLSPQLHCRRKGGERNPNVRRKREKLENAKKNLRCVVTPPFPTGHDSDSIAEGKEAKGT